MVCAHSFREGYNHAAKREFQWPVKWPMVCAFKDSDDEEVRISGFNGL